MLIGLVSIILSNYGIHALTFFNLAELGSVFYSVKEKTFDERGNRRQADREFSKRAELETEIARQRAEYVPQLVPFFSMLKF